MSEDRVYNFLLDRAEKILAHVLKCRMGLDNQRDAILNACLEDAPERDHLFMRGIYEYILSDEHEFKNTNIVWVRHADNSKHLSLENRGETE